MNNKILVAAVSSVALMAASCGHEDGNRATGVFEAVTVTVSAETAGKILSFNPSEGDTVAFNQTLCVVDTAMLVLQRGELEGLMAAAESAGPDVAAQAAELRARIAHQTREYDRARNLLADGAVPSRNVDDAAAALDALRAKLDALLSSLGASSSASEANVRSVACRLMQVDEQIARSSVKAPMAGVILEKYAEAGEFVTTGKPLLRIADMNNVYLYCYFTAAQLEGLGLGSEVTVVTEFGNGRTHEYPGRITWIAAESEFTPKSIQSASSRANLVYAAKVSVVNDGRIRLGQYADVSL